MNCYKILAFLAICVLMVLPTMSKSLEKRSDVAELLQRATEKRETVCSETSLTEMITELPKLIGLIGVRLVAKA